MRNPWGKVFLLAVFLLGGTSPVAYGNGPEVWRDIPVLHGGRVKPFDTFARESVRIMTGRERFRLEWREHPELSGKWDPVELSLTLLFSWPGWEPQRLQQMQWRNLQAEYWASHEPDVWDNAPLLLIQNDTLKRRLGFDPAVDHVSALDLYRARYRVNGRDVLFFDWGLELREKVAAEQNLDTIERKGWDLWNRYMTFITLRMGTELELLPTAPPPDPSREHWLPLTVLVAGSDEMIEARLLDAFSASHLETIRRSFRAMRQAFLADGLYSPRFAAAAEQFKAALREQAMKINELRVRMRKAQGPAVSSQRDTAAYPAGTRVIDLEVHYNRLQPFTWAAGFYLAAAAVFAIGLLMKKPRWGYIVAMSLTGVATLLACWGFVVRSIVAGYAMGASWRGPVTNLYETVVWVAFSGAIFGLVFELIYRRWWFAFAAAAVAATAMIIAQNTPSVLDPSISQIEPVLRTNLYLVIHVLTIVSSYAAGALAWAVSAGGLALYLFTRPTSQRQRLARELAQATYRCIQVAVVLLAAGTILGGVWAYDSWGRFWGWDPKEVWALISLLCYMIVLHGRFTGLWNNFGLLLGGHLCFLSILMSWYGVNFVLPLFNEGRPVGLHGYALGQGGLLEVSIAVALDLLFAGLASWRYVTAWKGETGAAEQDSTQTDQSADIPAEEPVSVG